MAVTRDGIPHEITKAQRDILRALNIGTPPRIYRLTPAAKP